VERRIKRPVVLAVGCVLLAGIAIGAAMAFGARAPASRGSASGRWSGDGQRLVWGSLRTDPERGFVRVSAGRKSLLLTTPEGAGTLRPVSRSSSYWVFRSRSGALALLFRGVYGDIYVAPSLEFLGRRLDPAKLGSIGSRGVAISVDWWEGKNENDHSAVVLVEQTPARHGSFANGWRVDGYLPGFSTRRPTIDHSGGVPLEPTQGLKQPLLGPDGRSYLIDVKHGRLVPTSKGPVVREHTVTLGGCSTWPGAKGASYRACSHSITVRRAHGPAAVVFHRPFTNSLEDDNTWAFVQPSPDGRWLLLEEANETCSYYSWAEFMPARGGNLAPIFPGSPINSVPLGWLPDNTALVEGAPQVCGGSGSEGIYQVRPNDTGARPAYQLVFPGISDVTTWGFRN
jgi:hypothetical protein